MRNRISPGPARLLIGALAMLAGTASAQELVTVGPASDWALEGMRPGMSYRDLDARFRLRDMVPLHLPPEKRYILESTRPLSAQAAREFEERGIAGLELVFREERLRSVRVAYAGQAELLFDDMGASLLERYGTPSSLTTRGPMQVGRAHGIRLYLWLSIWTWERDALILTVEGKHYGVDKVKESPESHKYAFTLKEADSGRP